MSDGFKNSPEFDNWIEETGGKDEEYSNYYKEWEGREKFGITRKDEDE